MSEKNNNNLGSAVKSGGIWMLAFECLRYLSQFVLLIVLARVLEPSDFGLLAMALVFIGLLDALTELGVKTALIQRKSSPEGILNTAWTILVIRGLILFTITLIAAPWIAKFFKSPELIPVLSVLGLKPLLVGLAHPATITLVRNFQYRRHFLYLVSGIITRVIVVIPAALILQNVWVLVIGNLIVTGTRLLLSYVMFPYLPKFKFNWLQIKELFDFGKWLFGGQIFHILLRITPSTLIGRIIDAAALGFYRMADQFGYIMVNITRKVASTVIMPVFSELNRRESELLQRFQRVLALSYMLVLPVVIGGALMMFPLLTFILGERWEMAVQPARYLFIAGGMQTLSQTSTTVMVSLGNPRGEFIVRIWASIFSLLPLWPLIVLYGITGAAISVLLGQSVALVVAMYILKRTHDFGFMSQLEPIKYSVLPVGAMGILAIILLPYANQGLIQLLASISVCAAIFFVGEWGMSKLLKNGPFEEVLTIASKRMTS